MNDAVRCAYAQMKLRGADRENHHVTRLRAQHADKAGSFEARDDGVGRTLAQPIACGHHFLAERPSDHANAIEAGERIASVQPEGHAQKIADVASRVMPRHNASANHYPANAALHEN